MNKLDEQYLSLLENLLEKGVEKEDRTGTGTLSLFGQRIYHDMSDGFPLLTTKKMAVKTMVTELKWFLRGDTNIKYLLQNNCHIWNGDAYKSYISKHPWGVEKEEFIETVRDDERYTHWGELGPIYGKQWRDWNGLDQIQNLINELKTNPDSRRLMVSAWNVGELEHMTLPPCHYGFQCYVREGKYLSLMWNQRSVDTFLGLPFNIASYGLLLELLAKEVNMVPDMLIGNLGDTHLYTNHIYQAGEQLGREGYDLPTIKLSNVDILNGEFDYEIVDYKSHPTIKAPLSN